MTALVVTGFLLGDENVLELGRVFSQHFECTKSHGLVNFKIVNFILCEYHLNF